MTSILLAIWLGCTADNTNEPPVFSPNRVGSLPQNTEDWWETEDAQSNVFGGAGVLIEDIDQDGWMDLVLLRRTGIRILLNRQNRFEEMSAPEIAGIPADGSIVDWDQDGDMDLLINTVFGDDVLCTWDDGWSTQTIESPEYSAGTTWYDVNRDGLLDFIIVGYGDDQVEAMFESIESGIPYPGEENQLWIQQPDHSFEQRPNFEQNNMAAFSFRATMLPFQQQTDWDLLIVNDFGHVNGGHQLFSLDNGQFSAIPAGHGLDIGMYGMGIDATDINDDLIPDVLITNINDPVMLVSQADFWVDTTLSMGLEAIDELQVCWGVDWYDVNNDGHEDVWIGCGPLLFAEVEPESFLEQPDALYLWTPEGYKDVAPSWGIDATTNTRGGGFADFNNDGCAELIRVARTGPAEMYAGRCPADNHWLDIRLDDGNRGIGATVIATTNNTRQVRWITAGGTSLATFLPQVAHFGFGADRRLKTVDIQVRWRDGSVSDYTVDVDQQITLKP